MASLKRLFWFGGLLLIAHTTLADTQPEQPAPQPQEPQTPEPQEPPRPDRDDMVNRTQVRIDRMMQSTIQWFDQIPAKGMDASEKKAQASGYLLAGWVPRSGEWGGMTQRFKVEVDTPNLEKRLKLIIDNDSNEQDRLDYESELSSTQQPSSLSVALRWVQPVSEHAKTKFRVGISRKQVFARGHLRWQRQFNRTRVFVDPGLEYYWNDGAANFLKLGVSYMITDRMQIHFSGIRRDIQVEKHKERKLGLYVSNAISQKRAWVFGAKMTDTFLGERVYNYSFRYRQNAFYSWLYWEVEPFVEFRRTRHFTDEYGAAFSLIGYYGKLVR